MLSIKLLKFGSEDYYLDLASEDYYLNGGEPPGQWIGSGCSFLNIGGQVIKDQLRMLMQGFHPNPGGDPDGPPKKEPLVQNAGRENRQIGWDLTFSAPKSVSVVWSQSTQGVRDKVQRLHHQAIVETIEFIESTLAYSRTGHGGEGDLVEVNLIAAAFEHGTSRAADPQLHTHTLVMNFGVDGLGQTRTIVSKPIFKNKIFLGALYRAHFAHLLQLELGLVTEREGTSFAIPGVPEELVQLYSTRRQEILVDMARKGTSGGKAAAQSAVSTRRSKKDVKPRHELFLEWQAINQEHGFGARALDALLDSADTNFDRWIPKIIQTALDNLTRNESHFTVHGFLREVLFLAPEYGVSPNSLYEPVDQIFRDLSKVVPLPSCEGQQRYTTPDILNLESAMLQSLRKCYKRPGLFVSEKNLNAALRNSPILNDEQRNAVRHITQNEHAVRIVQGYAGTGKTTMLRTAVDAWQASGFTVIGACFTGAAAEKLSEEIGIPCNTIHRTLADYEQCTKHRLKHHMRQFVRAAHGKRTFRNKKPKPVAINKNSIVLLDEAGMINTRHMKMLLEWVDKHGATIVPVGDAAQLAAVEGGSPFRSLSNRVGYASLNDIKRQKDEWARMASYHLARGEVAEALSYFDARGLIKASDDIDQALIRLVDDWADHAYDRPHHARILASSNDLVHQANLLAQQKRIDKGVLNKDKTHSIVDKVSSGAIYPSDVYLGDRVLFTKNNRQYNVLNGSAGTIVRFQRLGRFLRPGLVVQLDAGRTVHVPLSFEHIRLGYASTVHKTQGGTYQEAFVLLSGASQNLPVSYVQGTRSRLATHFYTERALYDEIQDLKDSPLVSQMEREVDLSLAADFFVPRTAKADTAEQLVTELLEHWKETAVTKKQSSLIVTNNPTLTAQINEKCWQIQQQHAQVDKEQEQKKAKDLALAESAKYATVHSKKVAAGDRVRFIQTGYMTGIFKNDFATVTQLDLAEQKIEVELDRGKSVSMQLSKMPEFEQGYAVTRHELPQCHYRVQNAYELQTATSNPATTGNSPLATGFSQPEFTQSVFGTFATASPYQPQNTYTFEQNQHQQAAAWHQKMQQVNHSTSWHVQQQQYLQQTSYSQQQEITVHQHRL